MIFNTQGILLSKINYSDTSLILRFLTPEFGLKSFIFKGAKSKKNKLPLFVMATYEITGYSKENNDLATVREIRLKSEGFPFFDVYKTAVFLFVAEILNKTIKVAENDNDLFEYIELLIENITNNEIITTNVVPHFLVNLTKYLGGYPHNNFSESKPYFSYRDGYFVNSENYINPTFDKENSEYLSKILTTFSNTFFSEEKMVSNTVFVENFLKFYEFHFPGLKKLKSLDILREVISN